MNTHITLWEVVARVESANHDFAIRFEDGYYNRRLKNGWDESILSRIRTANKCSRATAQMIYCSSWGAVQIMGFNLYNRNGMDWSVGKFMATETIQRQQFNRFLKENKLDHYTPERLAQDVEARRHFAKTYNGSYDYAVLLKHSLDFYGVK